VRIYLQQNTVLSEFLARQSPEIDVLDTFSAPKHPAEDGVWQLPSPDVSAPGELVALPATAPRGTL
jgi:hypothetical protein